MLRQMSLHGSPVTITDQPEHLTRLESTGTSPGICNLDFGLWILDFFYGLRMTQGYQLDHSISQRLLKHFFGNVILKLCFTRATCT